MARKVEETWEKYLLKKERKWRDELVKHYQYLVEYVLRDFPHVGSNPVLEQSDLFNVGLMGLTQAIERYDASRGKFTSFAVRRIRGAIWDELRHVEWAPRSLKRMLTEVMEAISDLESELGRPPSEEEIASRLGLSPERYRQVLLDINVRRTVSIHDLFSLKESRSFSIESDSYTAEVLERADDSSEIQQKLVRAIKRLPAKERLVITLYYYEGLNLKDIASVLDVNESRVSQLRSQAILRIRQSLVKKPEMHYD